MLYVGIAFLVLFLLVCFGLCSGAKNADEMMMLAYKEMMEERARKEGVRQITHGPEEGHPGIVEAPFISSAL